MGPSKRGRSHTIGAGDGRKRPMHQTEVCMTMMPVRDHNEPGQTTYRAPESSGPRGTSLDQDRGGIQTEARMTMMPVRHHAEAGQKTHRTPIHSRPRGASMDHGKTKTRPLVPRPEETQARRTMMPVRGHKELERTRGPSTVTHKARGSSRSESHALTTHGKPSTAAVPQTEARVTMVPVRSHKETDLKPKPSRPPKPQKASFGGRGTGNANKTEGKGKSEAKKPSFWRRFFGLSQPQSAARKAGLNRSATVGRGSPSRRGQDISHGRKSHDEPRASSTVRDLSNTCGGGRLRRATTSYGQPSTRGYSSIESDANESQYYLSQQDEGVYYLPSTGGYSGGSTLYEIYYPGTSGHNGDSPRYETYNPRW